jgi:phenylpropionate dioxygenase-like ring-hydroxylating dioxygenase large terminal subunit
MNADVKSGDYWVDWRVEKGFKLVDPPTLQDVIAKDAGTRPSMLADPGDLKPAPRVIPYDRYIDPKYVDLEVEHIWKKQWQVACRAEDIPKVGDRISYDIVDNSYLVVRSGPNEFKAFYNSCRHRGRKLCEGKASGEGIRCPFHAWEYGLDGKLDWMPYDDEFPHVDKARAGLIPVQAAEWGGNVFINPDPNAPPLEVAIAPLVQHYKDYPIGERYTAIRILVDVGCNWKAAQEAFMEGYHVLQTHADGMPIFGSISTQIDIWSAGLGHVSRLYTPGMTTDHWIDGQVNSRDACVLYCTAYDLPPPPEGRGETPVDARAYAAEMQRARLEANTGKDWSKEPVSFFIDMAKYFLFPNHHPWWGESLPWWYNFKPLGRNPDTSQMEIRVLTPIPANGEHPPVPEPYHVKLGERAEEKFPELGSTAHLLDQDLVNMYAVQLGFKAAAPGAAYLTLSNYHEAKIRRFHEIYDRLLGLEAAD